MAAKSPAAAAAAAVTQKLSWKEFLSEVSSDAISDDAAMELEKKMAMQLQQLLVGVDPALVGAHNVFTKLSLAELNQAVGSSEVNDKGTIRSLVSINNVLHLAPAIVAAALAQHGLTEALTRGLHSRITENAVTHELTHMIIMVLWVLLIKLEDLYGAAGADIMAQKSEVVEMNISIIIYSSNNPDDLFTQLGLATAARCVRIMWGVTRHNTPACSSVRSLCSSIALKSRVTQLAAWVPSDIQMPDPSGPPGCGPGGSLGELYISLLNVCSSFVASMLGLGGALDLRAEAMKPARDWLMSDSQLDCVRITLETLIEELHHHGRFLRHLQATTAGDNETGSVEDKRLQIMSRQVDGSIYNLLSAMGVPLTCASGQTSDSAGEATALVEFAMRYHHALYQAGYVDVFKKLGDRSASYKGDYLSFFVAFSGIMLDGTTDIGEQFFKWGVQLGKGKSAAEAEGFDGADFSYLEGSGVSSEDAEKFIRDRVMVIVDRAATMRKVIAIGQRAMLAGRMLPNVQQGAKAASWMNDPGPKAGSSPAHKDLSHCVQCGASEPVGGGTALQHCPCKAVAYCCKTCQVAHFPQHKDVCEVVLKKRKDATKS